MRSLLACHCMVLPVMAMAQLGRQEFRTDTGTVVLHFHASGQLSTREWSDQDGRWGRSWAYKQSGETIFNYNTRRIAGHCTVHFSYHPNGAVSKAEVSDAPDAGIQWYRSTTTFDEQGNRTGFWEESHEDLIRPSIILPPDREQPPAYCQKLFTNEVFLVNATRQAGKATVKVRSPSPALRDSEHTLAPGDTVRLGTYSVGERFAAPDTELTLEVRRVLRNRKKPAALGQLRTDEVLVNAEHRRYYVVVRSWVR